MIILNKNDLLLIILMLKSDCFLFIIINEGILAEDLPFVTRFMHDAGILIHFQGLQSKSVFWESGANKVITIITTIIYNAILFLSQLLTIIVLIMIIILIILMNDNNINNIKSNDKWEEWLF